MFDKEEFARKVKTNSGQASRDEGSTTINSLCEYIIRESLFNFMDLIEPVLFKAAAQNENLDELKARVQELENHNRFLMGMIGFKNPEHEDEPKVRKIKNNG